MPRPARVAGAALALVALALVAVPGPSSAHAVLVASSPADGSHLMAAPSNVTVTLSEAIEPEATTLEVRLGNGTRVDAGDVRIAGGAQPVVSVSLRDGLGDGVYEARWHTVAKDTHATGGYVSFAVGAFEPKHADQGQAAPPDWRQAAGRAVLYVGFSLAFGAAVLAAACPAWPHRRLANGMALGALAATVGAAGQVWASSRNFPSLGAFLASSIGSTMYTRLMLAAGAFAILAVAFVRPRPTRMAMPAAGSLLLVAAFQTSQLSHASITGLATIMVDFVHLASACTWLGSLFLFTRFLLAKPAPTSAEAQAIGLRFGSVALACLVVLTGTGTVTALTVGGKALRSDVWGSLQAGWGLYLLAKVVLAGAMVMLAAVNRYVFLAPAAATGLAGRLQRFASRGTRGKAAPLTSAGTTPELGRWVRREALLGALVLVFAGLLTSVSPPTSAATAPPATGTVLYGGAAHVHFALHLDPAPRAGQSSSILLHVGTHEGDPIVDSPSCAGHCVVLSFTQGNSTDRTDRIARSLGDGSWEADPILFATPGTRNVTVTIQSDDFFQDQATVAFDVAP